MDKVMQFHLGTDGIPCVVTAKNYYHKIANGDAMHPAYT